MMLAQSVSNLVSAEPDAAHGRNAPNLSERASISEPPPAAYGRTRLITLTTSTPPANFLSLPNEAVEGGKKIPDSEQEGLELDLLQEKMSSRQGYLMRSLALTGSLLVPFGDVFDAQCIGCGGVGGSGGVWLSMMYD